jgi:DNA-binding Lrp family transcriptional regulator
MAGLVGAIERPSPPVPLDDLDRDLLRRLAADPRISQRRLAQETGVSAPAVGDRIARLERNGVIRGYTITVDWAALGYPVLVYIPMIIAPGAGLAQIMAQLREIPELDELLVVTGTYDLMARFRLRDHAHLQQLLLDDLWPVNGLQRIETFLSLGEVPLGDVVAKLVSG